MPDSELPEKVNPDDGQGSEERTDKEPPSSEPDVVPPEAEEQAKKIIEQGGPKALLSFFGAAFSRVGPDPQTAKVLADVERHAEESRLKGYQATLDQRDKQQVRDHEYRIKVLNHTTGKTIFGMAVATAGVIAGVYLQIVRGSTIGGYILLASAMALIELLRKPFSPSQGD